jgi:ketosteroid isomerase-like protein
MNNRAFFAGILGLAAAVSLAGCKAPAPTAPVVDLAKEGAALNAENDVLNAAVIAKDADKIVAYDTDDTVAWIPDSPAVHGKAEDLAGWKASFADPAFAYSQTVQRTEVAKSGDLAYQTGSYDLTDTNPTTHKVEHLSGNWINTFRKGADGIWRSSAFAATQAPPSAKTLIATGRRCPC